MAYKTIVDTILDIVKNKKIYTQNDLSEELNALGFDVAQATLSRYVKKLNLIKFSSKKNERQYFIVTPDKKQNQIRTLFSNSVISIDGSENLLVIKTISGGASAVGMAVDGLNISDVMGTIAGDDTVLVILRDETKLESVVKQLEDWQVIE
ncbi:MAG: arginine repressor [Christensenellaceae bacterium]|jgi:transcriptional regulator of arginine metabolism|nr:arginine repressor [Christensenellaceae bacterium]